MIGVPCHDDALRRLRAAHAGYLKGCGSRFVDKPFYSASVPGWVFNLPVIGEVLSIDLVDVLRNWAERPASAWLYDVKLMYARWLIGLGMLEPMEGGMLAPRTTLRITPKGVAALEGCA